MRDKRFTLQDVTIGEVGESRSRRVVKLSATGFTPAELMESASISELTEGGVQICSYTVRAAVPEVRVLVLDALDRTFCPGDSRRTERKRLWKKLMESRP